QKMRKIRSAAPSETRTRGTAAPGPRRSTSLNRPPMSLRISCQKLRLRSRPSSPGAGSKRVGDHGLKLTENVRVPPAFCYFFSHDRESFGNQKCPFVGSNRGKRIVNVRDLQYPRGQWYFVPL